MNKEKIANILINESAKSLVNHAELYGQISTDAIQFLDQFIRDKISIEKKKIVGANQNVQTNIKNIPVQKQVDPIKNIKSYEQKSAPSDIVNDRLMQELVAIKLEVESCKSCTLHKTRIQTVFGEGSNKIKLVCIGEAPGEEEDKSGQPFVGKAGQLLTKMLAAISIDRKDIFICNVLKCRPPLNRDPNSDEVASCSGYLDRQLEILQPKYILALGRIAAKRLLNLDYTMAQFRTQMHQYKGIPVIVTYHPSALLRNPGWKQPAWEDLQKVQKLLGL